MAAVSIKENSQGDLFIYRILAVGGFFLFPIFGFIYAYTNPNRYDPVEFRVFFTTLSAAMFALTYVKSAYIKRFFTGIMYVIFYLIMIWILFLLFQNAYNSNYLLGFLLVIYVTTLGFKDPVHLFLYFLTMSVIFCISVMYIPLMQVNPYFIFITFQAMFMVSFFIQKTKSGLQKGIEEKNLQLQEKNKDITDSINYAKRIQDAITPSEEEFLKVFSDSFIFYQPKDVVSGDFCLLLEDENKIFICVADCTGHGVPGAFMSMIGHSQLNHIILEKKIRKPSCILKELNKSIKKALKQGNDASGDGMDISLCVIDKKEMKLEFSGAKRPLWIVNNGSLTEIQSDNYSIGGITPEEYEFTDHTIDINKGTQFYLFSDGYADQFGGPNEKKIMKSRFKKEISNVSHLPLKEQKELLKYFFYQWKSDLEQIDDVLVLGLKI